MLIKIDEFRFNKKSTWVNPDRIETVEIYGPEDDCRIYINTSNENNLLTSDDYKTYEEAAKVMDKLAEKINAAQGCKPAPGEKTTMKYEEHGDDAIVGVYRCSHCKTVIRDEYSWYKFCPACGREIERWE